MCDGVHNDTTTIITEFPLPLLHPSPIPPRHNPHSNIGNHSPPWDPHNSRFRTQEQRTAVKQIISIVCCVPEMRVNEYSHTYDYNWEAVTSAFWKKYCGLVLRFLMSRGSAAVAFSHVRAESVH